MESHEKPHGGADPQDKTSGGSGGTQGPDTGEDQMKDQQLGQGVDQQDVDVDTEGEPTTKPGASDQTPSSDA